MSTRFLTASLVLVSILVTGAQTPADLGPPLAAALADLAPPPPPGATLPNLSADGKGRLWLSWLEPREGGGHRFRLSSIDLGRGASATPAWSEPITVAEGAAFLANWADFPSVFVASDGTMAAHWLERGASRGEYGIRLRTSRDAGRTWTAPLTPHKDPPAAVEHGFVSFFEAPGAGLGLVWLDGREMVGGHAAAGHSGSMTLRSALIRNGQAGPEQLIDPKVCECCQTSAARTPDGVIVAYRDRSDGEIRDISVSRFRAGTWSAPATVYAEDWKINGCPVNGPAVATVGDDVAVAFYSAKGDPKVHVAFSTAGGAFSAPVRLDSATTYGRLGLVMPARDRAIVSSIERSAEGPQLILREARRDGRTGTPLAIGPMTSDRSSGFARLALIGRRLVVAWTDVRQGSPPVIRMRTAEIK